MIVKMLKYSFLVYHKEVADLISGLMDVGVLHVINKGAIADDETELLAAEIREAEGLLQRFAKRQKSTNDVVAYPDKMPTLEEIYELERELESQSHLRDTLRSERKIMRPWGDFSWININRIEEKTGLEVRFFRCPETQFEEEWKNSYQLEIINNNNDHVYFIIFHEPGKEDLPLIPLALPQKNLEKIESTLGQTKERIDQINALLDNLAANYSAHLKNTIAAAKDQLHFKLSSIAAKAVVPDKLILLEGWCAASKTRALEIFAERQNLVYVKQQPNEDEIPPVLLKNNRFTRLFEPIGNLFSLPAYSELDLTVYFAPFFLLFFGFCLGDMGYGLVLLLAGSLLKLRVKDTNRRYLTLAQLFGLSTMIIGFFSGTLFGLKLTEIDLFAPVRNVMFDDKELFNLALSIGFVQIIFGMGVQVYKRVIFEGWLSALNRIGWILGLLGGIDYFLLKVAPAVSLVVMLIGIFFIVAFGAPKSGWLKSVGLGLADLYNITGVMGDLLSYIRLFALGVSSAILGLVVNKIAFSAGGVPVIGIVLTVIILVVGHTANLMLASLSAFVHPMRLTFVEFYKNVGFIGGGKPYKPLKRKSSGFKTEQIKSSV